MRIESEVFHSLDATNKSHCTSSAGATSQEALRTRNHQNHTMQFNSSSMILIRLRNAHFYGGHPPTVHLLLSPRFFSYSPSYLSSSSPSTRSRVAAVTAMASTSSPQFTAALLYTLLQRLHTRSHAVHARTHARAAGLTTAATSFLRITRRQTACTSEEVENVCERYHTR